MQHTDQYREWGELVVNVVFKHASSSQKAKEEIIDCQHWWLKKGKEIDGVQESSARVYALQVALKEKLRREPNKNKTLGPLLIDAKKLGIISREDFGYADKVKAIGDDTVHDSSRCSATEAHESLTKTKFLLNRLYR